MRSLTWWQRVRPWPFASLPANEVRDRRAQKHTGALDLEMRQLAAPCQTFDRARAHTELVGHFTNGHYVSPIQLENSLNRVEPVLGELAEHAGSVALSRI